MSKPKSRRGGRRTPGPGRALGAPRRSTLVPLNTRVEPEERAALDRWRARYGLGQAEAVRVLLRGLKVAESDSEIRDLYASLIERLRAS